ncbi:Wound-induced protein 1 [Capsicum chinense]|nr:Wound-induced protein 1 [Capsicum chinense]
MSLLTFLNSPYYTPIISKLPFIRPLYKYIPHHRTFLILTYLCLTTFFSHPFQVFRAFFFLELANFQETLEETTNKGVVLALYEALSSHDVVQVQKLLASDLEWWFHGPPSHQFLMRILTGTAKSDHVSFQFLPKTIDVFGSIVLVEGCDPTRSITWVHAWTVTDGVITQVREYFNTSLTVTCFGKKTQSDISSITPPLHCPSVWESSLPNRVGKSFPGLVLAL